MKLLSNNGYTGKEKVWNFWKQDKGYNDKLKLSWSNHGAGKQKRSHVTTENPVSDKSLHHWELELSLSYTRPKNSTSITQNNTCQLQPYGLRVSPCNCATVWDTNHPCLTSTLILATHSSVQSYPTLCNPIDCSLSGSSVHENFQITILKWVAISFSRGSSWHKPQSLLFCQFQL